VRPGFFIFPRHDPTLALETIRRVQPSMVKFWVSATSPDAVRAWREASPGTIFLAVDGSIGDCGSKETLENIPALVQGHVDAWAGHRDRGFGSLYMTYNEPPIWKGSDYRKRLVDYTQRALALAHSYGLNLCIFNFSVGWPWTVLDAHNWWPEFAPAVEFMNEGDYLGLHEYWNSAGPTNLANFPWLCGRHRLCPYNKPILISECGLDQYTVGDSQRRGWRHHLSTDQYYSQVLQYHAALTDPRVKGTAIFLMDYENNVWESFDIRPIAHMFQPGQFDGLADPMAAPERVGMPLRGVGRVTQWFGERPEYYSQFGVAGHNGIDFSVPEGTSVLSVAAGKVSRVVRASSGYGYHVYVNHGWGQTLYAHLSTIRVDEQQDVQAGEAVGLSGNTGNSTGPHLHFGMRIYGRHNPAYNDWIDPAVMLELQGGVADDSNTAPTEPRMLTDDDLTVARSELALVPATMKVCDRLGYVWRTEFYGTNRDYVYAIAYDPKNSVYKALKLSAGDWQLVDLAEIV